MNEPPNPEVAVFAAALELPADQRGAYLDQVCAGDPALRRQVEALLRVHNDAGDFFDELASVARPTSVEEAMPGSNPTNRLPGTPSEKPGDRIGRYKLLQQIGEGGCGVVYMAEQEKPVRRRVALKVIKLGLDTKSVIARFEAERQALALMDHPNIAKVLDAGATENGRPYFVMELVRGNKITDYCDQNDLSTEARLELFVQVCQAVQHAHQKGIIHRDIKPSNLLVADHDGRPVPKIIDFGIAKATTDQRLTDKTLFTAFEQFIGTPAYMSPEQASLSGLDIDTRSDIYSLGVLLYELLTGRTPFNAKELLQAGLDEIRRTIREQEPPRPSTCLSTMVGSDLTAIAKHRKTEPPNLIHVVRGDLDWIVMKCLEKDRTRRYETANGVAMDVLRHLNSEPVVARPPGKLYKFQKLVRRNKLTFTAASAVTAALIIGLGVAIWSFFKEQQARREAEAEREIAKTEAAKATAISVFLEQALRSANPDQLKGSDYTVRQLLDDFSSGLENQFQNQPEVEAEVRVTLGRAYYRLGFPDKSQPQIERALMLRRRIFGEHEPVAATLVDYAWTFFEQADYGNGESQAREALAIYRKCGTAGEPVISALWVLAELVAAQGRAKEVDAIAQEALTIAGKSPGTEFPETASVLHVLAEVKNYQGKFDEGASWASNAVAMHRRLHSADHPETAWALLSLGVALRRQEKLNASEAATREALRIFRKYYPSGHKSVVAAMNELRLAQESKGDYATAEAPELEMLGARRATLGNDSTAVGETLSRLAELLRFQSNIVAEQAYRDALTIYTKLGAVGSDQYAAVVRSLRNVLMAENKPAAVEALYQEVIAAQRSAFGADSSAAATTLFGLANFLKSQNRPEEAAQKYRAALDGMLKPGWEEHLSELSIWAVPALVEAGDRQRATNICRALLNSTSKNAAWFNNAAWYLATAENPSNCSPALAVELANRAVEINPFGGDWNTVGVAYYRTGDFNQALPCLERGNGGNSWAFFFLAMTQCQLGNADAARRYYDQAIQWMDTHDPQNPELLRFRAEADRILGAEIKAAAENPSPVSGTAK